MGLICVGLLSLLVCFAYSYEFRSGAGNGLFVQHPELEWKRMGRQMTRQNMPVPTLKSSFLRSASGSGSTPAEAKILPEYLIVSSSNDPKRDFKPQMGNKPLPDSAVNMLLGSPSNSLPNVTQEDPKKTVEILCHVDRMYVRIKREVFKTRDAYKYLKLGTCPVNQGTSIHYYLLYLLTMDCGFKQESKPDYLYISNVLRYEPTTPVLREMPFSIPLRCAFPRLKAKGNEIPVGQGFTMGEPMYFEAKPPDNSASGSQRTYINYCFMTTSPDPTSSPKYTVIDNQGCMIDSNVTDQSKFLTSASKTVQKFTVGAFMFKDAVSTSSQKLYMHCEIATGALTATPSSKACNYDPSLKMWRELYGGDSVCACCESTCPLAQPRSASKAMISSHSWNVRMSEEDDYEGVVPRMQTYDTNPFNLEDPYATEHRDFLNYWEKHD
ncbi:zona pellucida sperm-binding protein 3 [Channa argus]|uniref:zona pellucida sperm-binding protein 3 n=1 Tax=Channa argus TaxID=215402 RepID=UPI003520344D